MLHNCEANGKSVTPGNIAYYTMLHTRSDRRFNYSGRSDAMGSRTQLVSNRRVSAIDDPIGAADETTGEPLTLGDALASEAGNPAQTAPRNSTGRRSSPRWTLKHLMSCAAWRAKSARRIWRRATA